MLTGGPDDSASRSVPLEHTRGAAHTQDCSLSAPWEATRDRKANHFLQNKQSWWFIIIITVIILNPPKISVNCYQGFVKMAIIWRTTDLPPMRKQRRLPGCRWREAEFNKGINSSGSPREPEQHANQERDAEWEVLPKGWLGSMWVTHLAEEARHRGKPIGESILPEARTTQRSVVLPRRTGWNPEPKVGEGKGLAPHTSVVLPAGQRN